MMGENAQEQAIGLSDAMRVAVLENLSDGVYFVDLDRRILYWNKAAEEISGFAAEEVLGRRCRDNVLNHCDDAGTILCGNQCPLQSTMCDGRQREAHVYLHHKDGHRKPVRVRAAPLRDAQGAVIGAVEVFHDDSELVDTHRHADYLESTSMSDPLTSVGNRRLGDAILAGMLEQHRRSERSCGVIFADIDGFKNFNDRFGHETGDQALRLVARTLVDTSRRDDAVIRWGGDEFLVLVADATTGTLRIVAERIRAMVERTRLIAERCDVLLSVSIGGTLAAPGDTPELIVRRADRLLYSSKDGGRNRVTLDADA